MGLRRFAIETSGKEEERPSPLIIKTGLTELTEVTRRQPTWADMAGMVM